MENFHKLFIYLNEKPKLVAQLKIIKQLKGGKIVKYGTTIKELIKQLKCGTPK